MEVFQAASISAGKVLIKHEKFREHASKIFTKHACNLQNFPKLQKILRNFIKRVEEF